MVCRLDKGIELRFRISDRPDLVAKRYFDNLPQILIEEGGFAKCVEALAKVYQDAGVSFQNSICSDVNR